MKTDLLAIKWIPDEQRCSADLGRLLDGFSHIQNVMYSGRTTRPHTFVLAGVPPRVVLRFSESRLAQSQQQASSIHASRPSFTKNQTMPSEVTASTHQAPVRPSTTRPTTTIRDNQPHVTLSIESARIA